jgi:hypothetical protein
LCASIKGVKALIKQALNYRLEYVTAKAIIQLDNGLEVAFLKNRVHF